jgi:uncharacterized membrane protein
MMPAVEIRRSITVLRPREDVYLVFRDIEELGRLMPHVSAPRRERTRWRADVGPVAIDWTPVITAEEPGRRLAWKATSGHGLAHEGQLVLEDSPGGRGTELRVVLSYALSGGARTLAPFAALLKPVARVRLGIALREIRQLLETGEIATGERRRPAPPAARRALRQRVTAFLEARRAA